MGRVRLGPESSVWFGAVVRADQEDVSIGGRTNIQDNAVLHADPGFPLRIGDDVSIGHAAVVHGCTVENGVLVGMGSVIMNGAVIGAGSTVAAGAVVLSGTKVPPGTLVAGIPAKVRRTLDEDEVQANLYAARLYVDLAGRHRDGEFTPRP